MSAVASRRWGVILAGAVLFGTAADAAAQYPIPPYGYGGYNPGPVGGALQGRAAVINSQGENTNQIEQAKITRQQGYQETVKTRRAIFDEMQYEESMTPTHNEKAAKIQADKLEHILRRATE